MSRDAAPSAAEIETALGAFHDPYRDAPFAECAVVHVEAIEAGEAGARVRARVRLGYPAEGVRADWEARLAALVEAL
ncbi:MAG: hypothetical protein V2J24_08615, partial [Pseudomonadales bacterium]|nr:hypothetical protein [Pseudomonadales bacterium]